MVLVTKLTLGFAKYKRGYQLVFIVDISMLCLIKYRNDSGNYNILYNHSALKCGGGKRNLMIITLE